MKKFLQFSALALCLSFGFHSNAQVTDGDFEAGIGAGWWTEASTNFGTPICDAATCGDCGGPCVANSGSFYAWFGGANAIETGSVEQSVTIPSGTLAGIGMMVKIAGPGAGLIDDKLEVSVDGNVLATVTAQDSVAYADYTLLPIDVSAMADGNAHTVRIEGFQSTATVFNILVDDVELAVDGVVVSDAGLFEEFTEPLFTVYPNPAKDVINLTFGELSGDAVVTIVSANGTVVSKQELNDVFNKNFAFNTDNMENGVYLVEVLNAGDVTTKRIVVAK